MLCLIWLCNRRNRDKFSCLVPLTITRSVPGMLMLILTIAAVISIVSVLVPNLVTIWVPLVGCTWLRMKLTLRLGSVVMRVVRVVLVVRVLSRLDLLTSA